MAGLSWCGVVAILLAYALNSFSWLSAQSAFYLALNIVGSLAVVVEAQEKKDTPAVALNIAWAVIGAIGLLRFVLGF